MSLLGIIIVLVVVGVLLWAVNSFIPMDPNIRKILTVVVIIAVLLFLLQAFGLLDTVSHVHVGRVH